MLEVLRRQVGALVHILPESASIVFGGGFPRRTDVVGRRAAQRAIFHVQCELERMALETPEVGALVCDRGTLDALAYWPDPWESFFGELGTSLEREFARYDAVVHLRVPSASAGYHATGLRIESQDEASAIDRRLLEVWSAHPRRVVIENATDFLTKTAASVEAIRTLLAT